MTALAHHHADSRRAAATLRLASPIGALLVREEGGALVRLTWTSGAGTADLRAPAASPTPLLAETARQLAAYFAGRRRVFELPLAPAGSPFRRAVWQEMCAIPYGATATYGTLARRLASTARAIGQACRANPIAIVMPCHRVVAADGLGGFSGGRGRDRKRFLLEHEGALAPRLL